MKKSDIQKALRPLVEEMVKEELVKIGVSSLMESSSYTDKEVEDLIRENKMLKEQLSNQNRGSSSSSDIGKKMLEQYRREARSQSNEMAISMPGHVKPKTNKPKTRTASTNDANFSYDDRNTKAVTAMQEMFKDTWKKLK